MNISKKFKEILIEEIAYTTTKMKESKTFDERLYFFSSVFGVVQRVYNIEYDSDLVYIHFVIRQTYEMFHARMASIRAGDTTVPLIEEQSEKLQTYTKELLNMLKQDTDLSPVLKKFAVLSYSTTGNGYYLFQKGILKI